MFENELRRAILRGEIIDFKVRHEDWNEYVIKDEMPVRLRGKLITTKVIKTDLYNPIGEPVYAHGSQSVFVTFVPRELRGEPTMPPPDDKERIKLIKKDLNFEVVREDWNEYELADGTILRAKLIVTGVQRTSAYSIDGDPLYNIQSAVVSRFIVPPELRRKE